MRLKVLSENKERKTSELHKLFPINFEGKEVRDVMQGGEMAKM
jgi:hypothetical protein